MATKKNYQELSSELDEILALLQSPDLDIDEALKAYERGAALIKELEAYINTAENKITKLKADFSTREK